jgi:hypothetical protein
MKKAILAVTLAALAFGSFALAQPAPVSPSPVKRTIVGKAEVPGANFEVITAVVEIAPGFKAGKHTHPGDVFYQVTEGEFWWPSMASRRRFTKPASKAWCRRRLSTMKVQPARVQPS